MRRKLGIPEEREQRTWLLGIYPRAICLEDTCKKIERETNRTVDIGSLVLRNKWPEEGVEEECGGRGPGSHSHRRAGGEPGNTRKAKTFPG